MEPDCYDGPNYNRKRPRWMTSYPKEGDEEIGPCVELHIDATQMPPGSRIVIQVPCCPVCGEPADMNRPKGVRRTWPPCMCGFSWNKWATGQYS